MMKQAALAAVSAWLAIAPVAHAQRPDPLAGRWTGSMTVGDHEYGINIWFNGANSPGGRYQLIGRSTDRNPVQNVKLTGNTITFLWPSRPPYQFRGRIVGNRMSGTATIQGHVETFSVTRVK